MLAEIGPETERFESACGWPNGLAWAPATASPQAGGAVVGRRGYHCLWRILGEILHAAARSRNARFGPLKKGLTVRRGTDRAVVALAHKILRLIYTML